MHGKLSCCQITRRMRIKKFNRCPIPHLGDFFIPPHQCPAPTTHATRRAGPGIAPPLQWRGTWLIPSLYKFPSAEGWAKPGVVYHPKPWRRVTRVTSHELRVTIKTGYRCMFRLDQPICYNINCQKMVHAFPNIHMM